MSLTFPRLPLSYFGFAFRLSFGAELFRFFNQHIVEEVGPGCQKPVNEDHIDYLLNRRELRHIHKSNVNRIPALLGASLLDRLIQRVIHVLHLVKNLIFLLGKFKFIGFWVIILDIELVEVDLYKGFKVWLGRVETGRVVHILNELLDLAIFDIIIAFQNHLGADFGVEQVSDLF